MKRLETTANEHWTVKAIFAFARGRGNRTLFGPARSAFQLAVANVRLLFKPDWHCRLRADFASALNCPLVCLQSRLGAKTVLALSDSPEKLTLGRR